MPPAFAEALKEGQIISFPSLRHNPGSGGIADVSGLLVHLAQDQVRGLTAHTGEAGKFFHGTRHLAAEV